MRSRPHPVPALKQLLLPGSNETARRLLRSPELDLSFNGRGALLRVFLEIAASSSGRTKVLLPAFHCPSAVEPALHAGLQPVFYRVRRDLSIDGDDLIAKADANTAAVLVIHFFGIAPDLAPIEPLRAAQIRVVEDCSHAFVQVDPCELSGDPSSDFRIYSFWKTVPCGIGGGVRRAEPGVRTAVESRAPWAARARNYKRLFEEAADREGPALLRAALASLKVPRLFSIAASPGGSAPSEQNLLRHGEQYYPLDAEVSRAAMPTHSRRIIEGSDIEAIARRRRENFAHYASAQARMQPMRPLLSSLPHRACPWVYPVLIEDRSLVDHRLRARGVALHTFGIYLHSALFAGTDERTVADALFLAQRVLCLAIHQDLETQDIDRSVATIREVLDDGRRRGA
jgi:perosamine synthetase